MSFIWF